MPVASRFPNKPEAIPEPRPCRHRTRRYARISAAILYGGTTYTYDAQSFNGQSGSAPAWGAPASQAIQNAAYLFAHNTPAGGDATAWAALQLAVWEALYDTGSSGNPQFNLANGRFVVNSGNSAAIAQAAALLAQLPNTSETYAGYLLQPQTPFPFGTQPQGLLLNPTLAPVPEPTTLVAGAFLLLPLGLSGARLLKGRAS